MKIQPEKPFDIQCDTIYTRQEENGDGARFGQSGWGSLPMKDELLRIVCTIFTLSERFCMEASVDVRGVLLARQNEMI
jgi:hypothetical protein